MTLKQYIKEVVSILKEFNVNQIHFEVSVEPLKYYKEEEELFVSSNINSSSIKFSLCIKERNDN